MNLRKSFKNTAYIISVFLFQLALVSCASTGRNARGPVKPKPIVAPWEYYASSEPAVMQVGETPRIQATAVQPIGDDTRSDKTHVILIGTLVGVLVVGGTVAGIMLAK
ncbi:MAG: hypothetical protein H7A32_02185 [Deltaproteobacteria bacterium]|nr:hypothetical protein [Deltaproteobacteria bacterium]